jgi:hypothetical protein
MMEAGFGMRLIIFILVLLMALSGCAAEDKSFILPVNYSAKALMKVYTDKTENDYKINIICRDGNYSIRTESENAAWNYAYVSGNRCILNNDKFPESSVTIENYKLNDILLHDFDFGKFDVFEDIPEESLKFIGNSDTRAEKEMHSDCTKEYKKYLNEAKNYAAKLKETDINFKSFDEKEYPSWFYYVNSK